MAVTKVINIYKSVQDCIDYVTNKDKTNEGTLVSTHGCFVDNAELLFDFANSKTRKQTGQVPVQAFHFIQSFDPADNEKLTPEMAHKIGQEYIEKLTGGKYSFVMSTHVDKGHIHNHFCVCAAMSDFSGKKFEHDKSLIYKMRKTSDEVCKENGLNVISNPQKSAMHYGEWAAEKNGKCSHRDEVCNAINDCIKDVKTYDEFLDKMRQNGWIIETGNSKKTVSGKYNTFARKEWADKDGKIKALRDYNLTSKNGKQNIYTIDKINERIEKRQQKIESRRNETVYERQERRHTLKINKMFNLSEMNDDDINIKKWKQEQNTLLFTKITQDLKNNYGISIKNLDVKINDMQSLVSEQKARISKLKESAALKESVIDFMKIIREDRTIYNNFNSLPEEKKEAYFEKYESRISRCEQAIFYINRLGFSDEFTNEDFKKMMVALQDEKEEIERINGEVFDTKKELKELGNIKDNLNIYWGKNQAVASEKTSEKNHNRSEQGL